jgi:hypothetical protein
MSLQEQNQAADAQAADSQWKRFYKVAGAIALVAVFLGLAEGMITFLPGGDTEPGTMSEWFTFFQDNGFLALRLLGLMNILITALGIPTFLALYAAHRRVDKVYAALAMIIAFIGAAVFFATNRAFAMLDLSREYAAATTAAQRSMLEAAGQAMLSVGQSHTPGTFLGFFLSEIAGITISVVMLRGKVFGRATALVGIAAFATMAVFEICSSFVPALSDVAMYIAMAGGLLTVTWYTLVGLRFFQLGRGAPQGAVRA